jgi:hypothetical protein
LTRKLIRNLHISFSPLPEFVVPSILQAPYKIAPLFPFSRPTTYVILSCRVPAPSSVWRRGTTPSGDELELAIKVQTVKDEAETIHQLAERKILQELEEGGTSILGKRRRPGGKFGDV